MDKVTSERFWRFLLVLRQVCLMLAGWIEKETNTKGTATGLLRSNTDPELSPLQFRNLTDAELDDLADRLEKRMLTRTNPH